VTEQADKMTTRFAKVNGVNIAYHVQGEGPRSLA
jgi:hypothetical protein